MQSTLKKEQGLKKEFEVVIPAKDIGKRTEEQLATYGKKAKIAGFRPGKAPVSVIKKRYGDSVHADVLDALIRESSDKIFKDNNLTPAAQPKITPSPFEEGKDFKFTMEFEIFPEVPDYDFTKLKVIKHTSDVTKQDVQEGLERIAGANKKPAPVTGRTKAQKGDIIKFDFLGKKGGVPFEGGKSEGFMLELGSGQFIPGFEDKMIGMEIGKEKTFPIKFPKEYHSKDLAGQDTEFTVKLHEIHESKLPELNDEFAKSFGLESLAKLEETVEKQIKTDIESVSFMKMKKELFDEIDTKHKFSVPESMIQLDYNSVIEQMKQETPQTPEKELEAEAKKLAERRVRLGIILSDLGKKNNILVTNDEIRQSVWQKASGYPGQEQRVIEFYQKNTGAIEQVRGEILEDKVVKFLFEKIKVTEKKISKEELFKEDPEEAGIHHVSHNNNSGHNHEHVHDENCDHDHHAPAHVHGPDCDHDHEPTKSTKKKK